MIERTVVSPHEAYLREVQRQRNREYMRRWRADPENRLKELGRRIRNNAHRKQQRQRYSLQNVCGFCHARLAKERVERLVVNGSAFRVVNVPYCGQC